ncbi:MAG: DUF177 domain-containing protein [Deltaproteobacteria bacterium]|nr:DUF177 domain-containing protein [Deltaproteobacteria bacterium]
MKIRFSEIPDDGLRLEINDEAWFPDQDLQRCGPVKSRIFLKRESEERVLIEGEIQTMVSFDCDRCLKNYEMELGGEFKLDLEYVAGRREETAEHECGSAEMDMMYLDEPVVDLFQILCQQVFLLVPEKHVCTEDCRGFCPSCGVNLNSKTCDCKKELKSSPFDVLKNL